MHVWRYSGCYLGHVADYVSSPLDWLADREEKESCVRKIKKDDTLSFTWGCDWTPSPRSWIFRDNHSQAVFSLYEFRLGSEWDADVQRVLSNAGAHVQSSVVPLVWCFWSQRGWTFRFCRVRWLRAYDESSVQCPREGVCHVSHLWCWQWRWVVVVGGSGCYHHLFLIATRSYFLLLLTTFSLFFFFPFFFFSFSLFFFRFQREQAS